jgi:hypothetical protein
MRYGARRTQNVRPVHCGRICHLHYANSIWKKCRKNAVLVAHGACTALKMAKRGNNDDK